MMQSGLLPVKGRFAPSPSGPLHFGSLVAALGSYLVAKSQQGQWLVRMEDIDTPRCHPRYASEILHALEQYGFCWDGPVVYQSQRHELYHAYLQRLIKDGLIYACDCSRARIQALGGVYDGHCAGGTLPLHTPNVALRLRADGVQRQFDDTFLGSHAISQALAQEHYIVRRRDSLFSYQLVVVVDDIDQQITQVIRGADLLDMSTRQQHLCQLFHAKAPRYGHLPLAMASPGYKLSKQNAAADIRQFSREQTLWTALCFLGQQPPAALAGVAVEELMTWAIAHFDAALVPQQREVLMHAFA